MPRRAPLALLSLTATLAVAQYPGATPPPADVRAGFDAIAPADARTFLNTLAGPEMEGRGTGQPGYQKAAEYMAARFREFGLKPVGDNGTYFQNVPFVRTRTRPGTTALRADGTAVKLMHAREISFSVLTQDVDTTAPVAIFVSAGKGGRLADTATLEGKVVLVLGNDITRPVARQIQNSKAVAVLYATPQVPVPGGWNVRRVGEREEPPASRAAVGHVQQAAALRLARALGYDGVPAGAAQGAGDGPVIATPRRKLKIVAKRQEERFSVPNVVALLEGSDPKLREEVVGIGAHLDHLGRQGDTVYPGADDDASGSTALLLVAKALAANPKKPRRGVLFMAFCGEEMGLLGSRHYTEHPVVPNEKMVAELQMDMVGRNEQTDREPASENVDTIHLVGSKRISTDLHRIVEEQNRHVNFRFEYDEEDVYTRSDHFMFALRGIPIAFLFDGFHPDYHQPTDTPDKINFAKIVSAARLFYLVAHDLATREERPKKDVAGG